MKKIALLILVFIPLFSLAQKCVETKDSFSGKVSKSSMVYINGNPLLGGPFEALTFTKNDGVIRVTYTVNYPAVIDSLKRENLRLFVKFNDGEVLKFLPNSDNAISTVSAGATQGMMIGVGSIVGEADMKKFISKPIEMIRMVVKEEQGLDIKIKESVAKKIVQGASCIN